MRKDEKTKKLLIFILLIIVLFVSLAYAQDNNYLKINGGSTMDTARWNIHLGNLSNPMVTGNPILDDVKITYNSSSSTLSITGVQLHYGDEVTYTFDVINDGTIDAILNKYTINNNLTFKGNGELSSNDENNVKQGFTYYLRYQDGSPIEVGTETNQDDLIIRSGSSKTYKLTIAYKEAVSPIIQDSVKVSGMKITLRYVQAN